MFHQNRKGNVLLLNVYSWPSIFSFPLVSHFRTCLPSSCGISNLGSILQYRQGVRNGEANAWRLRIREEERV